MAMSQEKVDTAVSNNALLEDVTVPKVAFVLDQGEDVRTLNEPPTDAVMGNDTAVVETVAPPGHDFVLDQGDVPPNDAVVGNETAVVEIVAPPGRDFVLDLGDLPPNDAVIGNETTVVETVVSPGHWVAGGGRGRPPGRVTGRRGRGRVRPPTVGSGRDGVTSVQFVTTNESNVHGGPSRGRGRSHPPLSTTSHRIPNKPVALQVQRDWDIKSMDDFATSSHFGNQMDVIDFFTMQLLPELCRQSTEKLALKLLLHSMEMNELNIFHLLISNALDSLLEYTNESLNKKKLLPLSYGEFRKIIGTLLLSSVFISSVDQSWKMMGSLMKDKNITIYTDFKQSLRLRHETMNN